MGANYGHFTSEETKRKISLANKGRVHSEQSKKNMSAGRIGMKLSEETKRKMSISHRGFKHSAEAKEKISKAQSREKNHGWKGGIRKSTGGILVLCPDHPFANCQGYVYQHRLVMEAHIGRTLLQSEVVHHINGNKFDNRIENLMLFSSNPEHLTYHRLCRSGLVPCSGKTDV